MPRPSFIFGLRTEILLSLTLLLVAAMMLTSFVILRITERDLLRYKTADGMAVVQRIQAAVGNGKIQTDQVSLKELKERLHSGISWMGHSGLYDQIVVVGSDGSLWAGKKHPKSSNEPAGNEIASVLRTGKLRTELDRERMLLTVTAPLLADGQCIAAVRVPVRIDAMSQGLAKSRTLIWFYIGLNVLVLVVFGNFLLSRIVIR
ncbi:MAG TPA: hypothetical protein EYP19_16930, partial [Desulfobacterales bacterium]|nr:hypothetical protein [Desulfobacterales bacterium]